MPMDIDLPILFLLLLVVVSLRAVVQSHITVTGSVFCDVCYDNSFTKYSYFLPGADVDVECKFQATKEEISFSVKRTTNRYGVYRVDVNADVASPIRSLCQATLIKSSDPVCNAPGASTTTQQMVLKSRSPNLCVYAVSALTFTPFNKNSTLCAANYHQNLSFNSSKFFLPWQFPPFPPLPQLPPFPQLPPLPQLPPFPQLPPLPQLPPFPQLPPLPQLPPPFQFPPSLPYPPPNFPPVSKPPVFNFGDPRTWIPNIPSSNPLPPTPPFNPTTWTSRIPPPPLGFELRDPTTWIPTFPPSPQP